MNTTDTERDERLREARVAASVYREAISQGVYTEVKPEQRRVLDLDAEVTRLYERNARLDAVVTAARDLHKPEWVEHNFDIESDLVCKACGYFAMDEDDPCPTVRALDGGAA